MFPTDPAVLAIQRGLATADDMNTIYDRMREQGNSMAWSGYVAVGAGLARLVGVENFSYFWDGTDPVTGEEYGLAERMMYGTLGAAELGLIGYVGAKGLVGKGPKAGAVGGADDAASAKPGTYQPARALPKDPVHKTPVPDTNKPHTQLGTKHSSRGYSYTQAREWGENGQLIRDIDFTDHLRPGKHPNPHQHRWEPNSTGGTMKRSKLAEPLDF